MRKWAISLCIVMLVVGVVAFGWFNLAQRGVSKSVLINVKPEVVPSVQEWLGGTGSFTLGVASRIVVDRAYTSSLLDTAHVFQSDLLSAIGRTLPVVSTRAANAGDFFFTLTNADRTIGDEGYLFNVADTVTISAHSVQGVFYGTRTALQILMQDPLRSHIARGVARDYPRYKERGFMLDVGRKFFTLAELESYVKLMAWYKMNDFQLHLNDNAPGTGIGPDWMHQYATFRLNSAQFKGLAAKDGSYSRQNIRELQDLARHYAVTITPEIDTPAHALALTQYRPDIASPQDSKEFLDLSNPNTYKFVNSLWNEFLPWFDTKQVHIGADEYIPSDANQYRQYINTYDAYLKRNGRSIRAWGSLSMMKSPIAVHTDVVMEAWNNTWANPVEMVKQGFQVINANDQLLYIVPKAGYYHDYLDTRLLYNKWEPNIFDLAHPQLNLQPGDPHLLGGMFAEWNDKLGSVVSSADVYARVKPAMQTVSEKLWRGATQDITYDQFQGVAARVGAAPGTYFP